MVTPGIYAPSPVPDPAVNQTAFGHQDAMDRFTVRVSLQIQIPDVTDNSIRR